VQRSALTHARLMRESTDRIERASRSDDVRESLVAHRVLASPGSWHSWELEHSGLMRHVADYTSLRHQAAALRRTTLRLVHGKALFEYLKNHNVRGESRLKILAHFYPARLYEHAVLAEHAIYLRKSCSYMCASHVSTDLVHDVEFLDPMRHYESLYAEYFDLYCATLFPGEDTDGSSERALLPLLKHQLNEWRWVILNPKHAAPRVRRESELRRPLGDTQRMSTLKMPKPGGK
jgi:hypothetical protein